MAKRSRHLQKVIAHAEERLQRERPKKRDRKELLELYKRFLKIERHRLKLRHGAGVDGREIAARRSGLLDIVLSNLFEESLKDLAGPDSEDSDSARLALVAVGGYGRGLLNPGSDIDLLFLTKASTKTLRPETSELIEQILYMLWDVGFKVGHSVRSIKESMEESKRDFQNFSAMIEARLIVGNSELFEAFLKAFQTKCITTMKDAYLDDRLADRDARHEKHQTVYLQEPQVKEGLGSLREYHNISWITFVHFGTTDIAELVEKGLLSESGFKEMEKAYDFLLTVRNHLHYAEKHPTDILTLRLQGVVATEMEYPERTILRRCESFMRDYYQHTSNMLMRCNEVFDRLELRDKARGRGLGRIGAFARSLRSNDEFDEFFIQDERLYPKNPHLFDEDPSRMMRLFQHTQLRGLQMSAELVDLVQANYHLINRSFRYSRSNRETFDAILSRKGSVAWSLRQMHRIGFLGKYLPEFGSLTCLVQHEFFHRYTADEHTLKTIEALDDLVVNDNPRLQIYKDIFHHLEDPFVIYMTLIMHDTGRAANMRHHEDASTLLASKVCNRLKISMPRRKIILFLVDHHLTLYRTATTKNTDDPEIIAEFGDIIGSKSYLDTLLLLTYVDSVGTNEEGWTGWKESLIVQLYHNTRSYLKDRENFQSNTLKAKEELRERVEKKLGESYSTEIQAHFDGMPPRYFNFRSSDVVAAHVKLFRKFFKSLHNDQGKAFPLMPVLSWEPKPESGWTVLRITTWNQSFLLARLSGSLAANGINILSADFFRRSDDLVLDLFRLCNTDYSLVESKAKFSAVEETLRSSLTEPKFSFQPLIKKALDAERTDGSELIEVPTRVVVRNDPNGRHTLVEIQARDRIGLLHDVSSAIAGLGNEVCHARINTEKGAAVDTIYIWDETGNPLSDEKRMKELEETLDTLVR